MSAQLDLFGQPVLPSSALRKDGKPRRMGYASRPGTGPKGQRCNTCAHFTPVVQAGSRAHKCGIVAARWTYTEETNIHPGAPACRDWARRQYAKRELPA